CNMRTRRTLLTQMLVQGMDNNQTQHIGKRGNDHRRLGKRRGLPLTVCGETKEPAMETMYFRATNESTIVYTSITGITEPIPTLIDSGASKNFMDISWACSNNIPLIELPSP